MGSCKEYSSLPETPAQTQTEPLSGFKSDTLLSNLHPGEEKGEESLVEGLKNVALEDNDRNGYEEGNQDQNLEVEWQNGENCPYPLKPYAENCSFYLKTGYCKYGMNCKFNHPVKGGPEDKENQKGWAAEETGQIECKYYRTTGGCRYGKACRYKHSNEDDVLTPLQGNSFGLPMQVGIKEKMEKDGCTEQTGQIECKYYLTTGGCKYGKACRYSHSKEKSRYLEKSELPLPQLNFVGLPIRMLEKECAFYMRTGSCAYGSTCKYNHPDPSAAAGSNTFNSAPSGFGGHSSGNYNGGYNSLPLLMAFEPTAASLSSNRTSDKHVPYLDNNSSYSHGTHLNSEWNGRQVKTSHPYLAPSIHNGVKTADISELHQGQIQFDELPERPGAAECPYFMKTGYCKFKAGCKFHHPKARPSKPPAVNLSSVGLPIRPDKKICWNYEKFGICKYGGSCHFHHPENFFSSAPQVDSTP